eukprot:359236-Chlamydomonas_euryale.AAC.3
MPHACPRAPASGPTLTAGAPSGTLLAAPTAPVPPRTTALSLPVAAMATSRCCSRATWSASDVHTSSSNLNVAAQRCAEMWKRSALDSEGPCAAESIALHAGCGLAVAEGLHQHDSKRTKVVLPTKREAPSTSLKVGNRSDGLAVSKWASGTPPSVQRASLILVSLNSVVHAQRCIWTHMDSFKGSPPCCWDLPKTDRMAPQAIATQPADISKID